MDEHGVTEQDAFSFIQRTADERALEDARRRRAHHRRRPAPVTAVPGPQRAPRASRVGAPADEAPFRRPASPGNAMTSTLLLIDGNSLTYRAFFALPAGHGDRLRPGHQRRVRLHVDAHQPAQGPPARSGAGRLRPARADVPPRGRSPPTRPTARRRPTSCASRWAWCARWSRRSASPIVELAGFEADDIIATATEQAVDRGDDVVIVTGDRDAYQLVEDPHVKVLYNRRGVSATTRSTTRPASSSAPASRRPSTRVRGAAGRPVRQPARRARAWGRRRRPS